VPGGDHGAAAVGVLVVRNETPLFSDVLAQALKADRRLRLLAPPVEPQAALRACRRHRPDVVVVEATQAMTAVLSDLVRPITGAFDAVAVVLVLDEIIDDAFLIAGLEAGAAGIVDASAGMGEVVEVVRAAAGGERLLDSTRLATAVETAARTRESERKRVDLLGLLSDREREVLSWLTRGKRNSEIARELWISPRTVEKHVHHILDKLEVESRLAAVALATEMGGLTHPEIRGTE
jgi:DNA-binding NarL/FixJ family response regulator